MKKLILFVSVLAMGLTSGMFLYVDSVDKVYDLAMRHGARSLQIPNTQEYGYTAGIEDPFGNQWWITEPTMP